MEAKIAKEHGIQIAPEARQWMRDDWTLRYYYDNAYVAYRRTPEGVEVLAVGWDEASDSPEGSPEARQDVIDRDGVDVPNRGPVGLQDVAIHRRCCYAHRAATATQDRSEHGGRRCSSWSIPERK